MVNDANSDGISRRAAVQRLGAVAGGAFFAGACRNESVDIIIESTPERFTGERIRVRL